MEAFASDQFYYVQRFFNPLYTGNPLRGTLVKSADLDEMQHYAAFHQGLHCLLRLKHAPGTEIHHNLENSTCDPLKYTMGSPILILSISQQSHNLKTMSF